MDLNSNFSFGTQWYQEKMMHYDRYEEEVLKYNATKYEYRRKETQNTFTLRLTYKAMQDTLDLSLFSYIRPEDKDSLTKIEVSKKLNDDMKLSIGHNQFTGDENYSDREFGMLKDDSNTYLRFSYNF